MFSKVLPLGSNRRIVAGNTVSQLVGRAVSSVSVFLMSVIIARSFGAEGYGDFVKITTYVGFFYLLADFGINAVYVRRTVTAPLTAQKQDPLWQLLFGLRLVMSGILIVVALAMLVFFPVGLTQGYTPLVRLGIQLFVPVILFQAVTTTTNALFQRLLRYDLATAAQNAGSLVMIVVVLILAYTAPVLGPLLGVVAVFLGSIATSLVALYYVQKQIRSFTPRLHISETRRLFTEALPLGLALVFNLIYFHADSVILTIFRSTREVGVYGFAYKVFEFPLVVPIFFMNSVYPVLLAALSKGSSGNGRHPTTSSVFRKSFTFLLGSSILIGIAIWFGAPFLTLIRSDFSDSIAPLRILTLSLPVFFISALYMWFIIAERKQHILLVIHGIAMVANITLNFLLVPNYGYIASAWITVGSETLVLAASVWYITVRKQLNKGGIV